jgi:hypothetical protein
VIHPVSSKMASIDAQIREKELNIKKDLHILAQKDRILAESNKFSSFLSSSGSSEEEMTFLLKEIEGLASKSSVYLVDLKPASLKVGAGASSNKYMVSLNCEAQMEQLISFMYNIVNSDKLLMIEKYQIGPKSKESSVAKCSMIISKIIVP